MGTVLFGVFQAPRLFSSYMALSTFVVVVLTQMQNYLHCNTCDGKHRRYSTDRFVLTARFCGRCNTRHAAKEVCGQGHGNHYGCVLRFFMSILLYVIRRGR